MPLSPTYTRFFRGVRPAFAKNASLFLRSFRDTYKFFTDYSEKFASFVYRLKADASAAYSLKRQPGRFPPFPLVFRSLFSPHNNFAV
jgi:hypothetical protein